MDAAYILTWMVGAALFTLWVRSLQHPLLTGTSWRIICPAIAVVVFACYQKDPHQAGWVAGWLYLLLVVLPQILPFLIDRLIRKRRLRLAQLLARLTRILHPGDGLWDLPTLIRILRLWDRQAEPAARALWEKLPVERLLHQPFSRTLVIQMLMAFGEWERALQYALPLGDQEDTWMDLYLPIVKLRALGEMGKREELLTAVENYLRGHRPPATNAATGALFLFAFWGQRARVEKLLQERLQRLPPESHDFWRATTALFAGHHEEARPLLQKLQGSPDLRTQRAATRRLEQMPLVPALPPETSRLEEVARLVDHFFVAEPVSRRPYVTNTILVILLAVFAAEEWLGGSTENEVLFRLGAAHPVFVFEFHQYWRLLAGGFLHYGIVHLIMNLLGLRFLGPVVESLLGRWRFTLLYFICLTGSLTAVTTLGELGLMPAELMVGASGGIMGLVGWLGFYFLKEWLTHRTPLNRHRVQNLLLALAIQVAFDLSTENVSFAGHTTGAIVGFLMGAVFEWMGKKERAGVAGSPAHPNS